MKRKKVILDVDTGSDDAVAIMSAVLSDELDVVGIVASFGNQALEYTLSNTLRVVEMLKRPVPVYRGFGVPLAHDLLPGRRVNAHPARMEKEINGKMVSIHERNLPLPGPTISAQQEHAVPWLLRTLRETKEKITIIPVGPMTNIAAVMRMDPQTKNGIEEIVLMGGGVNVRNITMAAEINFYNDPEAAKIVMDSGVKVTAVTLDATHSSWFGYPEAERIRAIGNPASDFAADMLTHRIDTALEIGTRKAPKSALHDVLAVCAVIDPTVLTEVKHVSCDVDIGGSAADGMLLVDPRDTATPDKPTYVAYRADGDKLLDMLCAQLKNYY